MGKNRSEGRIACPVCGKHMFRYDYEICPVCGWIYDYVQLKWPDDYAGANGLSLNEYLEGKKLLGDRFSCRAYEDILERD